MQKFDLSRVYGEMPDTVWSFSSLDDRALAAATAFDWTQRFLAQHCQSPKREILRLEPDQLPCPSHVAVYYQHDHLWLMGWAIRDWVCSDQGYAISPAILTRCFQAMGTPIGYVRYPNRCPTPVFRLPTAGRYRFTPRSITIRGALEDVIKPEPRS